MLDSFLDHLTTSFNSRDHLHRLRLEDNHELCLGKNLEDGRGLFNV